MPKISIIVAVYNQENLISKCVESILNQTFRDLELILINDGSTDNSGNVIDEYARRDNRVRVIHQENVGLAEVRNVGIKAAKGEYIGFVDGDDWVDKEMYEILYNLCEQNNADVSSCLYNTYNEDYQIIDEERNTKLVSVLTSDEAIELTYQHRLTNFTVWNKLFKKHIFNTITFPKGREYEDAAVLYQTYSKANKIIYIESPLYNWYVRKSGITKSILSKFSEKKFDRLPIYDETYAYMQQHHPHVCKLVTFEHYKSCVDIFMYIINDNKNIIKNYKYIKFLSKHMKGIVKRFEKNKYLTKKQKIMARIFADMPMVGVLYYKIRV